MQHRIIRLMILGIILPNSLVSSTLTKFFARLTLLNYYIGIKDVDYAKYPKKELQLDWLRTYLEEYHSNGAVIEVTDSDVRKLYVETNQFVLAAHVFWGIWSLIQAEHSYIDFDFIE